MYKLSKMSADERKGLVEKGKRMVSDNVDTLKHKFGRSGSTPDARMSNMTGEVTFGG